MPLYAIYLHIFHHIAQIYLEIRQYSCGKFRQSDDKSDCVSGIQWLCGVAIKNAAEMKLSAADIFGHHSMPLSTSTMSIFFIRRSNIKPTSIDTAITNAAANR